MPLRGAGYRRTTLDAVMNGFVQNAPPTQALVQATAEWWLCESENCEECVIDRPQLVGREISHSITKSLSVDRSKLFDENTRRVACDGYFGSKRCRSGAP